MRTQHILTLAATALFTSLSCHAAQTLLINFSSAAGNDISGIDAAALGADAFQNVRTNTFGPAGVTKAISLDGVTGSVTYADYYQQNQLSELGQPFATYLGSSQIGSTGLESTTSLDLSTWMTSEGYSSYTVMVYYAGRSLVSETELTTGASKVHFNDGISTPDDTVTVTIHGQGTRPGFWGGNGAVHTFTGSNLTIDVDDLVGNGNDSGGISAIQIVGVPEPSSTALLGLGGLALIMRRRRN